MFNLEIASFNPHSALLAAQNGASRIELCTSLPSGGLTPSLSDFKTLTDLLPKNEPSQPNQSTQTDLSKTQIHIMIRPHSNSFIYLPKDIETMLDSIAEFKDQPGCTGFVFGALTKENLIDVPTMKLLLEAAKPLPCTFHRAFDLIPPSEMASQLDLIISLEFKYLLTSGGAPKAGEDGWELLEELVGQGREGGLEVIVGGGIRQGNVEAAIRMTGTRWVHSSAVLGEGEMVSVEEVKGLKRVLDALEGEISQSKGRRTGGVY